MADYEYITAQGVIIPDTADTRAKVEAEYRLAFGADFVTDPETPQGVMVTADIEREDNTARAMAEIANQINPDLASGVWLDAHFALFRSSRRGATRSTIAGVKLSGVSGTVIPLGSQVSTTGGDIFESTLQVTIPPSGDITVDFIAVETGPVRCDAHELTSIVSTGVLGWTAVDNDNAAVLGRDAETDLQARTRRRSVIASLSRSPAEAIISGVQAIPEVQSLRYLENDTAVTATIEGVSLSPHSIWLCINGGAGADIAKAIKQTKTIGAGTNGSESVTLTDEASGQPYTIYFDRPTPIVLLVRVTVRSASSGVEQTVKDAVMAMAAGKIEGEQGFVVGRGVSPFEISAAVNFYDPTIFVSNVELSDDGGSTWTSNTLTVGIDEIASLPSASYVQVVIP